MCCAFPVYLCAMPGDLISETGREGLFIVFWVGKDMVICVSVSAKRTKQCVKKKKQGLTAEIKTNKPETRLTEKGKQTKTPVSPVVVSLLKPTQTNKL